MIKKTVPHEYMIIHEAAANPEITGRPLQILRQNNVSGKKVDPMHPLTTITFEIVLQSCSDEKTVIRNWNGRDYQIEDVLNALNNNPIVQYNIKMDTWTNEMGHPIITKVDDMIARQMTVMGDRACDKTSKYRREGNLIIGECTTLAGGLGELEKVRILTGHPVMKSSRAIGRVGSNGRVAPGYTIRCFDSVETPSHKEAYMTESGIVLNGNVIEGQTFNESAVKLDVHNNPSLRSFILTEAAQQIEVLCNALDLDYGTLKMDERNITIQRINESSTETIIMPIRQIVGQSYADLF